MGLARVLEKTQDCFNKSFKKCHAYMIAEKSVEIERNHSYFLGTNWWPPAKMVFQFNIFLEMSVKKDMLLTVV